VSALTDDLVAAGALVGMCAAAYGYGRLEAWLEVTRQVRRFRRQLRTPHAHLHYPPTPEGSGREPPPR